MKFLGNFNRFRLILEEKLSASLTDEVDTRTNPKGI